MNTKNEKENRKKQITDINKEEGNTTCFDCDKSPANWASIKNGIFLCQDCSIEHRGYSYSVSLIKSAILDNNWNDVQISLMRCGGNNRLKSFLMSHNLYRQLSKRKLYTSSMMDYYRKMIRAESNKEPFLEQIPENDLLFSSQSIENLNIENEYHKYEERNGMSEIPMYDKVPFNYNKGYTNFEDNESKKEEEDDKYTKGRWYYFSYVTSMLYDLKEKITNSEINNKVIYAGGKALEYIFYTGGKIYEKGVQGLNYLRSKIQQGNVNQGYQMGNSSIIEEFNQNEGGEALIDKNNVLNI